MSSVWFKETQFNLSKVTTSDEFKQSQKPQPNSDKTLNKPDYGFEIDFESDLR